MSVSYIWKINQLQLAVLKDGFNNVVQGVDWSLSAVDGDYSVETAAKTWLENVDPSKFVQFESLDESTVISWVQDAMDAEVLDSFKNNLNVLLEEKKSQNAKVVLPPWQS
jgi:hypothetical protein